MRCDVIGLLRLQLVRHAAGQKDAIADASNFDDVITLYVAFWTEEFQDCLSDDAHIAGDRDLDLAGDRNLEVGYLLPSGIEKGDAGFSGGVADDVSAGATKGSQCWRSWGWSPAHP